MKLIDLIAAISDDPESDIKIQICHPGRSWRNSRMKFNFKEVQNGKKHLFYG